ncbi:MAG TPA: hypothetical protein VNZ52_05765, partial [Candidatus Thermoplasmatota archaeon]|nr:hypothetical protein [Candidatus Thermoplasmatota archaeon]
PLALASADKELRSPTIQKDGVWSHTFTTEGEYPYICTFHPNMKGRITVTANANVTGTATVDMIDNDYIPRNVQVAPGTNVTWVNLGKQPHNVRGEAPASAPAPGLLLVGAGLLGVALLLRRRGA